MNYAQRLRALADRTGLDGFGDELRAMASEMEAASDEVVIAITPEKPVPIGPRMTWHGDTVTAAQPVGEPVASIYISPNGDREFDDWKCALPVGRNILCTTPQPVAVPDGKPLGYLPQWAVDRLTGEMGAVADPVTWGLHAPIMSGDCPHHVAIYTAPQPTPLPEHADHVPEIAARLRLVANLAGCHDAVPQDDEIAVGAIFSVLGNMRFKLERLPSRLQPSAVLDALAIFERLTGRDDDPVEARQAYETLRLALVKKEGGPQ